MALFALKEKYKQQLSTDELGRLHELYMEFILYFKKICIENDLQFYLCGGGCIGAVRNRGFIPWDDDLDVFMPREDYEKLKSIWEYKADNNRYPILYPTRDRILHNQFITIIDANTTFIRPYQKDLDIPHGIALDVFPLDGCPSNKWQRKKQIFWGLVYSLFCSQVIPNNHGALLYYIGKSILGIIPQSFFYTIWKHAEDKMSSYKWDACDKVTELCAGPHYMMNEYPKRAFLKSLWVEFEHDTLPIPIGYDDYLRIAFGDYRKLPPKEKQVGHHEALFMDLENSYKIYKGQYYCTQHDGEMM